MQELKTNVQRATDHLKRQQKAYDAYKSEMLLVIQGQSTLSREILNEMLIESKDALEAATADMDKACAELENGWSVY